MFKIDLPKPDRKFTKTLIWHQQLQTMTRRRDSDLNGHKSWEFERSVSIKKKKTRQITNTLSFYRSQHVLCLEFRLELWEVLWSKYSLVWQNSWIHFQGKLGWKYFCHLCFWYWTISRKTILYVIWLLLCCHTWNWSGQDRTARRFEGFLKFDNYFPIAISWKNSWNFELDFSSSAVWLRRAKQLPTARRFLFTSKYVEKS